MAEETVETKPTPQEKPTLSSEEITELIEKTATEKATSMSQENIEKMKEQLVESISGKKQSSRYGESGPESWDTLHESIVKDAEEKAEKRIFEKLEAQKKQEQEEKEKQNEVQKQTQLQEATQMTKEWADAVSDGLIPDIKPEIKEKLKSGKVQYKDLSEEEQADPGLKAYNEARILHVKLKQEGKTSNFYRTIQKFYSGQPRGAYAPVMGGGAGGADVGSDFSYDEVKENRKKMFGF